LDETAEHGCYIVSAIIAALFKVPSAGSDPVFLQNQSYSFVHNFKLKQHKSTKRLRTMAATMDSDAVRSILMAFDFGR
jgi:hypothetical protein